MENLVAEHGTVIISLLGSIMVGLLSIIIWYIKTDRSAFLMKLKELNNKIDENKAKTEIGVSKLREEVQNELTELRQDMEGIKSNYIIKFEKVYDKQDDIKEQIKANHEELLKAIHLVELKVAYQINNNINK